MDPYLERPALWPDVHIHLISAISAELNAVLPMRYSAVADAHVWIHEPDARSRYPMRPDVFVTDDFPKSDGSNAAATATVEPASGILPAVEREGDKYLKIMDAENNEVVTVIEILSPTNKKLGPHRDAYLTKRNEYFRSDVHVIEIDFLRGGQRTPVEQVSRPITDYCLTVCRAEKLPKVDIWPFSVREAIPSIPVPLRRPSDEPILNLRRCLDRVYDEHRFRRRARYDLDPIPPIREADREFVQSIVQSIPPEVV
jgi:hypothetical protein